MSREVILHVYDLSHGMASQLSQGILGFHIPYLPHTGVVLDGQEYFFGGGIQVQPPHVVMENTGMTPCERTLLGRTSKSDGEIRAFLDSIRHKYTMSTYDLIRNNCNHFANDLSVFLIGSGIPQDIVGLPERVQSSPMGSMVMNMMMGGGGGGGGGAGGDPLARAFGGAAQGGGGGATSSSSSSTSSKPAPLSAKLKPQGAREKLTAPLTPTLYPDTSGASLVQTRLEKAMGESGGALTLTPHESNFLGRLSEALGEGATYTPSWVPLGCALCQRVLEGWPSASASFPAALLVRLLARREDCLGPLTHPTTGALTTLLTGLLKTPEGWGLASTNNQTLQALCNALGSSPAGAQWGARPGVREELVTLVAREVGNSVRGDYKILAMSLAGNLIASWGKAGKVDDEALNDTALQLLCGLLTDVQHEASEGVAQSRLTLAASLLAANPFKSGDLKALALSLDVTTSVQILADSGGQPPAIRELAGELIKVFGEA